jgi:hypothetical protein
MLPFMGHAATAPSSPTGLNVFMEMDDCPWSQGATRDQPENGRTSAQEVANAALSGQSDVWGGSEGLNQYPLQEWFPADSMILSAGRL